MRYSLSEDFWTTKTRRAQRFTKFSDTRYLYVFVLTC